jgi:hypothetical protein
MPDFPAWPIHENGRGMEPLPIATRRVPAVARIGLGHEKRQADHDAR